MIPPSPSRRGFLLLALFLVFNWDGSLRAQLQPPAQDTVPTPAQNTDSAGLSTYQNAQATTILDLYESLSQKHLILDSGVLNGVPPITLNGTGLSKAEMLKMIEATLLLNGVGLVPVDDHTVKAIAIGSKKAGTEGVKIYANASDLPTTEEVVSYYMPLSYINPLEAKAIFDQNAPAHAYGGYVPAPSAQAIVLTENSSVIRQLIALKELIDVPPARVTSEFVQLNRADATTVADLLNKLLDPKAAPGAAGAALPGGGAFVPARLGVNEPMFNEHNLLSGSAQIMADTRSNGLFIVTRPVNLPFLKQIIAQLDQPDIFMVPKRRALKYVLAQDILPALETALAQGKDEEDQVAKNQTAATGTHPNQPQSSTAAASSGSSSGSTGAVSAITPQLTAPTENNAPTVVTVGKTRLMADNRSNSIIVFGSPDVVSRVFDMIDQLDCKPLQVYLATVIGELTVSEGQEFGIDILQKFQKVGQGGLATGVLNSASSTTAAANVPEPSTLTSSMGFPLLSGLNLYGAIGSTLDAYVRALETTDRFKVISRPSVYTTNNNLAVIASGSQVPVPSNITSGFTGTTSNTLTTTASVQYENVLLQLDIIPLINADKEVTLKIRQTDNTLGANNNISGNNVPTINTQEINTEITVPDKSTVVIGGLITDDTKRDTTGVPWLSDIPVLGYLFKDTTKSKERDELIIMIQPSVVETDADQIAVNEAEKQRTILGREAVAAATGFAETAQQAPLPQARANPASAGTSTSIYNSKTGTSSVATPASSPIFPTSATPSGPTSSSGIVPAASSPAPNVSNGQMPKNLPLPPSAKSP